MNADTMGCCNALHLAAVARAFYPETMSERPETPASPVGFASGIQSAGADVIFTGGPIVTMNRDAPRAEAIAIKDGRILAIGTRDAVLEHRDAATTQVQLDGKALLPGFVEPHVHLTSSAAMYRWIDLSAMTTKTFEEAAAKVASAVRTAGSKDWIRGQLFDESLMAGRREFTLAELDAIAPDHAVFVLNASGHKAYVNSKACAAANITAATPEPGGGGKFFKDSTGRLTGTIAELPGMVPFLNAMPKQSEAELRENLQSVLQEAATKGCTHLHDAGIGVFLGLDELPFVRSFSATAPVRIGGFLVGTLCDRWMERDDVAPLRGDDRFRLTAIKFWSDGSNQGMTGYLRAPYEGSDSRGLLNYSVAELMENIRKATAAGWSVGVHANGDAALDATLDAFEAALGNAPPEGRRNRIEHCSLADDAAMRRMAALGLLPSFLIGHVYYWGRAFRDRIIGPERAAHLDATASAQRAGLRFSLHSDLTTTSIDPLRYVYNAVTRIMRDGGEVLAPEQRISVGAALRAITIDAAYQCYADDTRGSLEPGKFADFVLLSEDPTRVDPMRLPEIEVVETWLAGVPTHPASRTA